MNSRFMLFLLVLVSFVSVTGAFAAEVKGSFWEGSGQQIPSGSDVVVSCGGNVQRVAIAARGNYSVRGLPSGRGCELRVITGSGVESSPFAFSTSRSVVLFNAEIRRYGNAVLLLPR